MWQRKRHVLSWQSNFFGGAFGFGTTSNCAVIRRFYRLFACLVGSTVFFVLNVFVQWIIVKIIYTVELLLKILLLYVLLRLQVETKAILPVNSVWLLNDCENNLAIVWSRNSSGWSRFIKQDFNLLRCCSLFSETIRMILCPTDKTVFFLVYYLLVFLSSKKLTTVETFTKLNLISGSRLFISPHNGQKLILSFQLYFTSPKNIKLFFRKNVTIS